MLFRKKSKTGDDLTSVQKIIYDDLYDRYDHRLSRLIRNMLAGGAVAEMGVAVAVDLLTTGGTMTALYAVTGLVSVSMTTAAVLVHQDENRTLLAETKEIALWEEKKKNLTPVPALPPPPEIPALLKMFMRHSDKGADRDDGASGPSAPGVSPQAPLPGK